VIIGKGKETDWVYAIWLRLLACPESRLAPLYGSSIQMLREKPPGSEGLESLEKRHLLVYLWNKCLAAFKPAYLKVRFDD